MLVRRFRRLLLPRLAVDCDLQLSLWWDADILVGERWEGRIRRAMAAADFALLLVSPALLSRPFVTGVEIPALLGNPTTLIMPVGLQAVDFARSDLHGLAPHQVFRLPLPGWPEPRWFAELAGQNPARFCDELVRQISCRCADVVNRR